MLADRLLREGERAMDRSFSAVMAGLKEKSRHRENEEENCRLIDDEKQRIDIGQ